MALLGFAQGNEQRNQEFAQQFKVLDNKSTPGRAPTSVLVNQAYAQSYFLPLSCFLVSMIFAVAVQIGMSELITRAFERYHRRTS